MFAQALEDELQMLCMLLAAGAGDENIVDVTETEVQTSQNLIHEPLVWAAFLRPKGIRKNSNSPNGVVMAVFGMSSSSTGIWWYARMRSMCVKILAPWRVAVKSCRCGIG